MSDNKKILPELEGIVEDVLETALPDTTPVEAVAIEEDLPVVMEVEAPVDPMQSLLEGNPVVLSVPGTKDVVNFTRILKEDKVVSVWVDGNTGSRPDYVIVNPPTEIINSSNQIQEDPLGALAVAIHGANS